MTYEKEIEALEETLENLTQQKEEVQAKIERLKRAPKLPALNGEFWLIDVRGDVYESANYTPEFTAKIFEQGRGFLTKKEAEFRAEQLSIEAELGQYARPFECAEENWFFGFDFVEEAITFQISKAYHLQGALYFESEEIAEEALAAVGEKRIKRYLFNVMPEPKFRVGDEVKIIGQVRPHRGPAKDYRGYMATVSQLHTSDVVPTYLLKIDFAESNAEFVWARDEDLEPREGVL